MPIIVYCVKMEPEKGRVICRNLDVLSDVFFMGLTPKPVKKGQKFEHPPGIPFFQTVDGMYLQINKIDTYYEHLRPHQFDLLTTSHLVNMNLVDRIILTPYGNEAYFIGGGDIKVPVSKYKTQEYKHLVVKRSFGPEWGF
ncbi:hypothetical protein DNH61_11595 [Paenibacillus sambharensis]|uniref:LytTR family transcriptional regulator n=1 Tax=Paenibacillus sambharensis TaxID=1803190 RepID=A0A2W1L7E7_9BACL|nr:hypothetical protein [Paenibacillus sambharensis]PZD95196.1 hypothetical protein DNH61_11595 [Paenibacillus sambharensis]